MKEIKLETPLSDSVAADLRAGDQVLLSGIVYTARDAAHKRLCELLDKEEALPVDLQGQVIYFTGPTPPQPGRPLGSAGPTTSYRMDAYSPRLIEEAGLKGMIGKGGRSEEVIDSMKKGPCVYFAATGGAGALLAKCVLSAEIVCYEDLGAEAIRKLQVKDLPLVVAIDSTGGNLYER
jgi:fumarate hydratase subunit beta